jgi:thiamine biosynthesis protein ThiI
VQQSPEAAVVRYGEAGIKSDKVRGQMLDRLAENVRAILDDRGIPGQVERHWSRVLIRPPEDDPSVFRADDAARAAADAFGVVSTRPAITTVPEADALGEAAVSWTDDHPEGATFAVRANRAGAAEVHPFTSQEVASEVGAAIGDATGADVDLDDPDRVYRLDVREDEAFVSAVEYDGPGGLPVGTQGKVVALFSGGIDSPVAAYELFKRGLEVVPVYLDLGDYGGSDHLARAIETAETVARSAPHVDARLRVVPAGDLVDDLVAATGPTRMLSLRRAMLRTAEAVAEDVGAHSVATGESIGQKSSQTGPNVGVTDAAASLPVHRPLLTLDKPEIVERAREIGTFVDATVNVGCERVAPNYPETNATLADVEAAEPDDLLDRAAALADERSVAGDGDGAAGED